MPGIPIKSHIRWGRPQVKSDAACVVLQVAIHPTVRGSTSPGRCAAKALRLLNESASSQSASGGGSSHGASGGSLPQAGGVAASQGGGALSFSKPHTYEAMGHAMVPHGQGQDVPNPELNERWGAFPAISEE